MARINISISENALKKVDKYKEIVNLTRSGLIIEALESYFARLQSRILEEKKKKAIEGIIQIREKISNDLKGWNSTEEIKRIRNSRWTGSIEISYKPKFRINFFKTIQYLSISIG